MANVTGLVNSITQLADLATKVPKHRHYAPPFSVYIDTMLTNIVTFLDMLKDAQYLGSLPELSQAGLCSLIKACDEQIIVLNSLLDRVRAEQKAGMQKKSKESTVSLQEDKLEFEEIYKELKHIEAAFSLHFIQFKPKPIVKSTSTLSLERMRPIHSIWDPKQKEESLQPDYTYSLETANDLGVLYKEAKDRNIRFLLEREKPLGPDHISTLETVNNLGLLYRDQGKLAEAENLYLRAFNGFEKALGPKHIFTLKAVINLGILYKDQGKLVKAEKKFLRALEGLENLPEPDNISILKIYNSLGFLYKRQGKLVYAEIRYCQAFAKLGKILVLDCTCALETVNSLAFLYRDQGRLVKATYVYRDAIKEIERVLGPDHVSTLDIVKKLGVVYSDLDMLFEAEKMFLRVLHWEEKHGFTSDTVNILGNLYRAQGKLSEAENMYLKVLRRTEILLGPDHTSTLVAVDQLGVLYRSQSKLAEAEKMHLRALEGFEKTLGPDHIFVLETVNNLGILYRYEDKLVEAEKMFLRALEGKEKVLGPDHRSTLDTVNSFGNLYRDQEKLSRAENMYLRAHKEGEKALGPNHTSTLVIVHNLGLLHMDQGWLAEAESNYLKVLRWFEKKLGPDHTSTLAAVDNLGILYKDKGKLAEAENMHIRALRGLEKVLGSDHIFTLQTVNNLGVLYKAQARLAEAEKMNLRAFEGRKKILGPDHKSTLKSMDNLASTYWDQKKLEKAEELQFILMESIKRIHGAEHPDTLTSMNNLVSIYMNQGKWKESKKQQLMMETKKRIIESSYREQDDLSFLPFSISQFLLGANDAFCHAKSKEIEIQAILLLAGISKEHYCLQVGFNQHLIERGAGHLQEIYIVLCVEMSPQTSLLNRLGQVLSPYQGNIVTPSTSHCTPVFKADGSIWELNDMILTQTERSTGTLLLHKMPSFHKCVVSCSSGSVNAGSTTAGSSRSTKQINKGKGRERGHSENPDHEPEDDGNGMSGDPGPGDPEEESKEQEHEPEPSVVFEVQTHVPYDKDMGSSISPPEQKRLIEQDASLCNSQVLMGQERVQSWPGIPGTISKILRRNSKKVPELPVQACGTLPHTENFVADHDGSKPQCKAPQNIFQELQVNGEVISSASSRKSTLHVKFKELRFQGRPQSTPSQYQQALVRVAIDTTNGNTRVLSAKPSSTRAHEGTRKQTKSRKTGWTGNLASVCGITNGLPLLRLNGGASRTWETSSSQEITSYGSRIIQNDSNGMVRWIFVVDDEHEKCGIKLEDNRLPEADFKFRADVTPPPRPQNVLIEVASYWSFHPSYPSRGWPLSNLVKASNQPFHRNLCQIVLLEIPTDLSSSSDYRAILKGFSPKNKEVPLQGTIDVTPATMPVKDLDNHCQGIGCLLWPRQKQENGYAHDATQLPTTPQQAEGSGHRATAQEEQTMPNGAEPSKSVPSTSS